MVRHNADKEKASEYCLYKCDYRLSHAEKMLVLRQANTFSIAIQQFELWVRFKYESLPLGFPLMLLVSWVSAYWASA